MSMKGQTNRKWNSTDKYRDAFDRIFRGNDGDVEGTIDSGVCGDYEVLTSMCNEYQAPCDLRCLNEREGFGYAGQ